MAIKISVKQRFLKIGESRIFNKRTGQHVIAKRTYVDTKTGEVLTERQYRRAAAAYKGGYKLGSYRRPDGAIFPHVLTTLSKSIDEKIHKGLLEAQKEIMQHADDNRHYTNLKGDTYTSTMSALYHGTRTPILMQLPSARGKTSTGRYMLQKGGKRSGSHKVKLFDTGEYIYYPKSKVIAVNPAKKGYDVAVEKLMGYYQGHRQGLGRDKHGNVMSSIVLTTGTEHASLIEKRRGLNVLSATRRVARKIVLSHIGKYLKNIKRK